MDILQYTEPKEALRILFVEDNDDDLQLILRELHRDNLNIVAEVAKTKREFTAQLLSGSHDVIVADYRLNGWTGMDALDEMRGLQKDVPFILVTGFLGEELAVDCVRRGVSDYVLKDRLARLPVSIRRAVNEIAAHWQRKRLVDKAKDSEAMFHTLAESIDSAIFVYIGSKCLYANHEAEIITGYNHEELLSMNSLNLFDPESREDVIRMGFRDLGL